MLVLVMKCSAGVYSLLIHAMVRIVSGVFIRSKMPLHAGRATSGSLEVDACVCDAMVSANLPPGFASSDVRRKPTYGRLRPAAGAAADQSEPSKNQTDGADHGRE